MVRFRPYLELVNIDECEAYVLFYPSVSSSCDFGAQPINFIPRVPIMITIGMKEEPHM